MKDNFNIHSWRLNQALKEIDEVTFTSKHDDNPKLKGGQKELPDELQAKIVKKEEIGDDDDVLGDWILDMLKYKSKEEVLEFLKQYINDLDADALDETKKSKVTEGEDHEVFMAQNSLQAIISAASQLMTKLGDDERNLPGWIQDHIVNAENYIEQANQGFHEIEPAVKDVDADALDMVAENVSENKKKKAKNALSAHLKAAIEDDNKEGVEEIKKAKAKIDNAKSIDVLVNVLGDFGFESDEISKILGK